MLYGKGKSTTYIKEETIPSLQPKIWSQMQIQSVRLANEPTRGVEAIDKVDRVGCVEDEVWIYRHAKKATS